MPVQSNQGGENVVVLSIGDYQQLMQEIESQKEQIASLERENEKNRKILKLQEKENSDLEKKLS